MFERGPMTSSLMLPDEAIVSKIYLIRGEKVMLDADLVDLYKVLMKELDLLVKRNRSRFTLDFMVQLTTEEWDNLKLQFETSRTRGGRRYPPFAFTEHVEQLMEHPVPKRKRLGYRGGDDV